MNKPSIHEKGQSGQAIVLIALTMVILLGAIGLAIDGGGMFLLYRDAQNAVDSASLSAAFALCTDDDPIAQAYRTLDLNGFVQGEDGVTITVREPVDTGNPSYENENHIQIILNAVKPSYFIQAVYQGPLVINVEAISFCDPGSATTSASPERERAFTSLRDADECTSSVAWNIAGSRFTIEGDVWMPNINPNIEFNSDNTPDPTVEDNPADILGNIFVGRSSADQAIVDGTGRELLVEDLPNSPAGDDFAGVYSGHGGDGVIEFSQPAPANPLPWDMDYFRPGGQLDLDNAAYVDASAACQYDNKFFQGDYNGGGALSAYYNDGTKTWTPGIYYSPCEINLDTPGMQGNVTWISEGVINFNSDHYTFTAYGDAPLAVSNYESSGDHNNCSAGTPAIYFNADHSVMTGPIIAFQGAVELGGNGYVFNTCVTAVGIDQVGNSDSIYRCVPGQSGSAPGSYGQRQ